MATLAETLGAQANPDIDIAGGLSEGVSAGIKLATAKEQIDATKLKVDEQRLELDQKKLQAFDGMIKTLNRTNPAYAKTLGKTMRNRFQQYGFDPNIVDVVLSDPNFGRVYQNLSDAMLGNVLNDKNALAKVLQSSQDAGLFTEAVTATENALKRKQQDKQFAIQMAKIDKQESNADKKEEKDYKQALRLSVNQFEGIIKKDRENLSNIMGAAELLNGEGGIAQSAARRALAKAYNSGALTDADVNDFAGSKAYADRIVQFLKTGAEGTLSDENISQLIEVVNKSAAKKRSIIEANVDDAAKRFTLNYGGDPEKIKSVFYPEKFMQATSAPQKPAQAAPAANAPAVPKTLSQAVNEAMAKNPRADKNKLIEIFSAKGLKD